MAEQKVCFVIAPIGDSDSETRKRSDQILKHVIKPAIAERGFTAVRADQISEPGLITSQVIQHILDDPLVLADLTERNPNVFYELALRHAARKPLVQLIRKGDAIPFDVAGMRTIAIDHKDLDSVEEAKREILRQIDASLRAGAVVETPVQAALNLQALQQSGDPQSQNLATIVNELTEIRAALSRIEDASKGVPQLGWRAVPPSPAYLRLPSGEIVAGNTVWRTYDDYLRSMYSLLDRDVKPGRIAEQLSGILGEPSEKSAPSEPNDTKKDDEKPKK